MSDVDYPDLKHGDIVEIIWDGGDGPWLYEVRIEHGIPVAWTAGHAPARVSPISRLYVDHLTRPPAHEEEVANDE